MTFGELTIGDIVYVGVKTNNGYNETTYTIREKQYADGISGKCVHIILNENIPTIGRADFFLNCNHCLWSTIPINGEYTVIRTFKLAN